MGNRENKVEVYLHDQVKLVGGRTYKWVSPGVRGVMDRIVIVNGTVWFVEVKTLDGSASPMQLRRAKELRSVKANVRFVYGRRGVDKLIEEIKSKIKSKIK